MRRSQRCGVGAGLAALLAVLVSPLPAQTRFVRHPGPPEFSRYTTPAQCLAAANRVLDAARWEQLRDTLEFNGQESAPPAVVETARRCSAGRFDLRTADPGDFPALYELALLAGDDALAAQIAERRLAAVDPREPRLRASMLMEMVSFYLQALPPRRDAALRTLARLDSLGAIAAEQRALAANQVRGYARAIGDTALQHTTLTRLAQLVRDSLQLHPLIQRTLVEPLADLTFLESGPRDLSVDGWLSRFRAAAGALFRSDTSWIPIGRQAAPLEGEFWFNRNPDVPRPRPGRWSLVVRLSHGCRAPCFPDYAVLKRLHRRFGPDIDITLITQTAGYYRDRVPPATAAEEAEWLRDYFLGYAKLPGALSVTVTPFVRFPAPDGRRRNRSIANDVNYGFADADEVRPGVSDRLPRATIVDPKGRIVYASRLGPENEKMLSLILDTFLRKQA